MQTSFNFPAGLEPVTPSPRRVRVASTVGVVALIHAVLIAAVLRATEKPARPPALESVVMTAQLLSPAPAPAAPAAVQSTPTPPEPRPVVKKKVEPRPARVAPAPMRTPAPNAPAAPPAPAPEPAQSTPAPAAPSDAANHAAQQQAAAPAVGRETLAISAPKNVSHLDCRIVKPDYPALSRRRGETGTAEVRFVVGLTGAIESITLAKSSGYPRLDDAAMAAMRSSSCRPYLENGSPVRAAYTQPFAFAFDD
ncbi:TonB family protein [Trinickia caryophylli]|uniref:Outer membrane transport energization protein TonB n=1 Tax=Trinickia caryophylli TaxID=28094 RepID=A0A1X7CQ18_TRICW|nr:energy transducer TonB [Trinickia caryophylli]PMS11312.1 energy transducer TonB [Trinickia caryophylli]TRX16792.1 energy transducer TonB [Trinickia caryophylli]WQE12483.1 TonB family protein [Trinickia caryophylli]SMF00451.1 outer membrane transport energization protein TonB [Trinickia caryophylli]GLU30164.1 protein TonB [Trinickia caryophylli]